WSGNKGYAAGRAYIFDPAVYYGDRETDLALSELFGGFSEDFYRGYQDTWPLDPGYRSRKPLYQLYHLLNHLNLFGSAYADACLGQLTSLLHN
ncbi:MAG: fructosamine kinase family protein, partial [Cellvibrionaceae bacterium]|nr:fructosamine kinase family protein [Cellvibrionaceae bacterium]